MTETTAAHKKPRTKPTGERSYVATVGGKEWLLKLEDVRVASSDDKDKALDGGMPRGKIVAATAGSGGA